MNNGIKIFDLARWPLVVCFIGVLLFLIFNCNPRFLILTKNVSQSSIDKTSIVSGAIASIIILFFVYAWNQISLRIKFFPLAGYYMGYDDEGSEISRAEITYQQKNLLKIKVTPRNSEEWEGTMIMSQEYTDTGNIVWKLTQPSPKKKARFGFKRCMVKRIRKDKIIYVIGESLSPEDDVYGKEIFKKIRP